MGGGGVKLLRGALKILDIRKKGSEKIVRLGGGGGGGAMKICIL